MTDSTKTTRSLSTGRKSALIQGLRYFASAAAGLAMDWAVFWTVWMLLGQTAMAGDGLQAVLSQVVSRSIGAVVAFFMFRAVAFRDAGGGSRGQMSRFIVAAALSWMLSVSLVWSLTQIAPLAAVAVLPQGEFQNWVVSHSVLGAKIISDGTTFIVNFFVMRFWVFKRA